MECVNKTRQIWSNMSIGTCVQEPVSFGVYRLRNIKGLRCRDRWSTVFIIKTMPAVPCCIAKNLTDNGVTRRTTSAVRLTTSATGEAASPGKIAIEKTTSAMVRAPSATTSGIKSRVWFGAQGQLTKLNSLFHLQNAVETHEGKFISSSFFWKKRVKIFEQKLQHGGKSIKKIITAIGHGD
nr:hypothetical protein Iba_chr13aCG8360 [Ipomoea batatas]GMD76264.1 hypothetical protein Iba_chr13bCG8690 [Ipomoea batatas]